MDGMHAGLTATPGAIPRIFSSSVSSETFHPVLEVRDIRPIADKRYALTVTDGTYVIHAVCGGNCSLVSSFERRAVQLFSLLHVTQWQLWDDGRSKAFCVLKGDVVGVVPEAARVDAQALCKWVGRGEDAASAEQGAWNCQVMPPRVSAAAGITPERRATPGHAAADWTPSPVQVALRYGHATSAREAPGERVMGNGVSPCVPSPCSATVSGGVVGASSSAAVGASMPPQRVIPIAGLSPYSGSRWRLKARLVSKSDVRKFSNQRGESQLFKAELADATGEITCTFFGTAVDKYFDLLQQGQVYFFSKGRVAMANRRYDRTDHTITFDEKSEIEISDDDRQIPRGSYNFRYSLWDITEKLEVGTSLDVKGVICDVADALTVTTRNGGLDRLKRELTLWDDSGPGGSHCMLLTLWGDRVHDDFRPGLVMFVRGARVNEWSGAKSLNFSGQGEVNPEDGRASQLLASYEASGRPPSSLIRRPGSSGWSASRQTVEDIRQVDLRLGPLQPAGRPLDPSQPKSTQRHSAVVTVVSVLDGRAPFYLSCPEIVEQAGQGKAQRQCRKKATRVNDDSWCCAAGHTCHRPVARYLFKMELADHTGSLEAGVFDEVGKYVFGLEADAIARLWEDPTKQEELRARLRSTTFMRFGVRLRSGRERFQDEEQVKTTAEEAERVQILRDARHMLSDVQQALGV